MIVVLLLEVLSYSVKPYPSGGWSHNSSFQIAVNVAAHIVPKAFEVMIESLIVPAAKLDGLRRACWEELDCLHLPLQHSSWNQ